MRGFVTSGTVSAMRPIPATLLTLLVGCNSPTYLAITAAQDQFDTLGSSGDLEPATTTTTGDTTANADGTTAGASTGDPVLTGEAPETGTTGEATDTSDTTDPQSPSVGDAEKPSIISVTLPAKLHAAGPVSLEVQTEHTGKVEITLDGADAGTLSAAGGGLFVGELAVRGAIDNGWHSVEVIARQGPNEVSQSESYEVETPAPGTMAWFKAGPSGSQTNRLARTPDGDTLEAGHVEINTVSRPSLTRRSGLTGAQLWSVKLDTREGSVADLAVLPDGRVWVAMNVRKPGDPSAQPRIALLDAAGETTGIEVLGDIGHIVRGIAADAEGGSFAVGVASAGLDMDIAYWRVNGDGVQTLGGTWDYTPQHMEKHNFSEFAMDVVVDGDVAWAVGASQGKHDPKKVVRTRGILVPLDLDTGAVALPIVAPASGGYTEQSVFFGAGLHPDGVLVTGYECDEDSQFYALETSLYDANGERLWAHSDAIGAGYRYGNDIALDSQGRVIVAGSITENGARRGYVAAHVVGEIATLPLFEHWFPASKPSEAFAVLVNDYDRIFVAGFTTVNGNTQARITQLHP